MASDGFSPEWLRLREPADHRSRPAGLLVPLVTWWRAHDASRVVDLGSGTGSNLRYVAPHLPGTQSWTLVDRDASLLALTPKAGDPRLLGVTGVAIVEGDLAVEGLNAVSGADLVTASALLDLVSRTWLDALVTACRGAGCAGLFALSWDGGISWKASKDKSVDADDALVLDAVRAHQLRDKGLGPALGPTAPNAARRAFRDAGFATWIQQSPWVLGPEDAELAQALVDGWASAAAEQRPDQSDRISRWAERRRVTTRSPDFGLTVGHVDLVALPTKTS